MKNILRKLTIPYNLGIGFVLLFLFNARNFYRNIGKPSVVLLDPDVSDQPFPSVKNALTSPDGLVAYGGDMSPTRLINAYRSGIFPWYSLNKIIQWWSPDPRAVLFLHKTHLSKSLRTSIRKKKYTITFDQDFAGVVNSCLLSPRSFKGEWKEEKVKLANNLLDKMGIKHKAPPYLDSDGTSLSPEVIVAYNELHKMGMAHSVEIWNDDNELVGGLFGVASGGVWCGESMFSKERDTSKIALVAVAFHIQKWGFAIMDCQILTPHLESMGAENITREEYIQILNSTKSHHHAEWEFDETSDLSHWKPEL